MKNKHWNHKTSAATNKHCFSNVKYFKFYIFSHDLVSNKFWFTFSILPAGFLFTLRWFDPIVFVSINGLLCLTPSFIQQCDQKKIPPLLVGLLWWMFVCFPELGFLFFSAGVLFVDRLWWHSFPFFSWQEWCACCRQVSQEPGHLLGVQGQHKDQLCHQLGGDQRGQFFSPPWNHGIRSQTSFMFIRFFSTWIYWFLDYKKASDVCLFIVLRHSRFSESSKSVHSS